MTKPIYICAAKRTAIGSFLGSLASISASALAAETIKTLLSETKLDPTSIDEVILGNVLTAGVGQAPARQAAIFAGLDKNVQAMTINKVCSSGLKAVMLAANSVTLGQAEAVIAGGMESMSNAPYLLPSLRIGARLGNTECVDSIVHDGLWDIYNNYHMGSAAELCARTYKLTREDQDAFAVESYTRASHAIKNGLFKDEIVPLKIFQNKVETIFDTDEEPGKAKLEKIPSLKAAFEKDGTITAANASSINDGAACMLVCSEEFLKKHKLTPQAQILSQGWHAQSPEWFTTAPVTASKNALLKAGKKIEDLDLLELNEAFSAVALACTSDLKIDPAKVNVHGGAVALGHPIGASGARILTTLIYALKRYQKKLGLAAICNGGGEATALLIESL